MPYAIKHICHIKASMEKVFEGLSSLEGLRSWWTVQTEGDPKLDGTLVFSFGERYKNVMYVDEFIVPILIRWHVMESVPDWVDTNIRFELDTNEGKTRLHFSHEGFKIQDDFYAQCNFSWAKYLMSLRQWAETGTGDPFDPVKPYD